jgi:hypothetical protein
MWNAQSTIQFILSYIAIFALVAVGETLTLIFMPFFIQCRGQKTRDSNSLGGHLLSDKIYIR